MIVLLSALAGGKSEFGARPEASSSAVMPKDQISAARTEAIVSGSRPSGSAIRRRTFGVVRFPLDHFRRHPARRADKALPRCERRGFNRLAFACDTRIWVHRGRDAEVGKKDRAVIVDEQIGGFDVSMNPAVLMEVDEPMQGLRESSGDHVFWEAVGKRVSRNVEERACDPLLEYATRSSLAGE